MNHLASFLLLVSAILLAMSVPPQVIGQEPSARLSVEAGTRGNPASDGTRVEDLSRSILAGKTAEALRLIESGCDVHLPNRLGETPIVLAALVGNTEVASVLLGKGVRLDFSGGIMSPLAAAAHMGSLEMMELLVSAGAPIHPGGVQPLHTAVGTGDFEKIRFLLEQGAEIERPNAGGRTPLMLAAAKDSPRLVAFLVSMGADPQGREPATGNDAWSPLCAAARSNAFDAARKLLELGADPAWADGKAIRVAREDGYRRIVDLLEGRVATPDPASSEAAAPPSPDLPVPAAPSTPVKVVLGEFTIDDNSYRSVRMAADYTSLLQARLAGLGDVVWVERSELENAARELAIGATFGHSAADALKLGKWLGADLLVGGTFETNAPEGARLRLEAIDLKHADLLGERTQRIEVPVESRFRYTPDDVSATVEAVAALLSEATRRRAAMAGKVAVAPLFVRNTSVVGDHLDPVEAAILERFAEGGGGEHRVLRFPRTAASTAEASLALGGFFDSDPDAWADLADCYVWGEYRGEGSDDIPLDKTPVRISLQLWDGISPPKAFETVIPLDGMDEGLREFTGTVLAAAAARPAGGANEAARKELAASIHARVKDLQAEEKDFREGLKRTASWIRSWKQRIALLELARFLDPASPEIDCDLLVERWNERAMFPSNSVIGPMAVRYFNHRCRQDAEWKAHVARFGFEALDKLPVEIITIAKLPGGFLTSGDGQGSKRDHFLHLAQQHCSALLSEDRSFPDELPYAVHRDWLQQRLESLVHRLSRIAEESPDRCAFKVLVLGDLIDRIEDPASKAQAIESVKKIARHQAETEEDLARFKERFGLPTDAPGGAMPSAPRPEGVPARPLPAVSESNGKPIASPKLEFEFSAVDFGEATRRIRRIEALASRNGTLHVAATNGLGSGLWSHDPASGTTVLDGRISPPPRHRIRDILPREDGIWLAVDGSGAWFLDARTGTVGTFGVTEGAPSDHLIACAEIDGRIYFGSDDAQGDGGIGYFATATGGWHSLDRGPDLPPLGAVGRLAASQGVLMVVERGAFKAPSLSCFDPKANAWAMVGTLDAPPRNGYSYQNIPKALCLEDAGGFWIGVGASLHRYRPDTGETTALFSTANPLEGVVTALADGGEDLWVAFAEVEMLRASPDVAPQLSIRPTVERIRKSDGERLGHLTFPCDGFATAMLVTSNRLWIGFESLGPDAVPLLGIPH